MPFLPLDPQDLLAGPNGPFNDFVLLRLTYYARENYSWNSTCQRENVKEPTTDGHNDRQRQKTVRGKGILFIADWSWECHQLGLTDNSSDSYWTTRRRFRIRTATRILKRNFYFIVSHVAPIKLQQLRIRPSSQSGRIVSLGLLCMFTPRAAA